MSQLVRAHPSEISSFGFHPNKNKYALLAGVHPADILLTGVHPGEDLDPGRGSETGCDK